ncbi:MAG: ABC transporter permease [Lentisphaeria bacterium]
MKIKQIMALASGVWLELLRRKDIYVAGIIGLVILVPLSLIDVFEVSNVSRYLSEISLLLIWISSVVIAVMTTARQLPDELANRTIYPLLAKPLSRSTVIIGKYIGSVFAVETALGVFYLAYGILMYLNGMNIFNTMFFQGWLLHSVAMWVICAMVLAFSVIVTRGANITVNLLVIFFMLLFGRNILVFSDRVAGFSGMIGKALHAILPHYEFYDMRLRITHGWESLDWASFSMAVAYGAVYSVILLMVANLFFRKRNL